MKITTIGLDLAKNVFQLHAVNEYGKPVLRKQPRREQVAAFSSTCQRAWSVWKPVPVRTTGHASRGR